jgi:16S rRNA (adenine1518-N6/adenine1519-N6)-dimethyltransferase
MASRLTSPRLKKRLGQHHLIRPEACAPLIRFLEPGSRRVLEVGPGGGVLTAELLAAGARVDAFELDPEWAFRLRHDLADRRLRLVVGDAMAADLGLWPAGTLLAGNLPYAISTALIQVVVRYHTIYSRAGFLVQREVAERLVASPGSRDYGALTVLVQAQAETRWLGRVRRAAFRPPPKVEGAFVGLKPHPPALAKTDLEAFARLVRLAFGNRRKTLRNALASGWGRQTAERVLAAGGVASGLRAEELAVDRFLALFEAARSHAELWSSETDRQP